MWRKSRSSLRKSLLRRDPAWGHITRIHGSWHQNPQWKSWFFFSFPLPQPGLERGVRGSTATEPSTSLWQKQRPISMPIVYRGLHHDSYLGLHWSLFDFSCLPLVTKSSQVRLLEKAKGEKKEKKKKKPSLFLMLSRSKNPEIWTGVHLEF